MWLLKILQKTLNTLFSSFWYPSVDNLTPLKKKKNSIKKNPIDLCQNINILDILQGSKHWGEVLKSEPCAGCIINTGLPVLPSLHWLKRLYLSWWKG